MTFWEHLDELRRRILWSLLAVVIAAVAGFALSDLALRFLIEPFRENVAGSLALLAPADGFIIQIKLALVLGAVIASPFVAYQMYGFVGKALRQHEKRWLWVVVPAATLLFCGGVVFAWLVFPTAIRFLGSFAGASVQNFWSLKNYISLVLFLHLAFGVIFQLPLVIGLLIASGLVPSAFFRRHRRYAIVFIFVLAAVATPTTDAITMMLMVTPLIFLYELSIWIGILIERRRARVRSDSVEP